MKTHNRKPISERFWIKVEKTDGCWIWTGAKTFGDYGVINSGGRNGKPIRAHRLSWVLHNGPIPDDLDVLHSCDTPSCVNPSHLSLGTAVDNMQDCKAKGRNYITDERRPRGEHHHQSKFTNEQIIELRSDYAAGLLGIRALARKYDVDKKAIQQIVRRLTWTHI